MFFYLKYFLLHVHIELAAGDQLVYLGDTFSHYPILTSFFRIFITVCIAQI
jgi:hypothetical protein